MFINVFIPKPMFLLLWSVCSSHAVII